jgi:hypothetical protein
MEIPPPLPPLDESAPRRTSGFAVASLVLGLLSFCTYGLASIPAIIFGHIAFYRIGKSSGRQDGRVLAGIGLLCGYGGIFMIVSAFTTFSKVVNKSHATRAMGTLKTIGIECHQYALEHDGKFPAKLEDLIPEYVSGPTELECRYPDPSRPVAFEYFGGKSDDLPKNVLASSPAVPGKARIFLHVDGSVTVKKAAELKREAASTPSP